MKPRIFIAVMTVSGRVSFELVLTLLQWAFNADFEISLFFIPGKKPVDHARNFAVRNFLSHMNKNYTHLCMIDDDIVPPLDAMNRLLEANKDIISPICFLLRPDLNDIQAIIPTPVCHRWNNNKLEIHNAESGVHETDVVPGGMILMKTDVVKTIKEKNGRLFSYIYNIDGEVKVTEDFYLSKIAKVLGYKLYIHYDIQCEHRKEIALRTLNYALVKAIDRAMKKETTEVAYSNLGRASADPNKVLDFARLISDKKMKLKVAETQ